MWGGVSGDKTPADKYPSVYLNAQTKEKGAMKRGTPCNLCSMPGIGFLMCNDNQFSLEDESFDNMRGGKTKSGEIMNF